MANPTCTTIDDPNLGDLFCSWKQQLISQPNAALTEPVIEMPIKIEPREDIDLNDILGQATRALTKRIQDKLASDDEDASELGDTPPSEDAKAVCLVLANIISPHIVFSPGVNWGVFTEDSGGISLTMQSQKTSRRLNYRIAVDGKSIQAIQVDTDMRAKASGMEPVDKNAVREMIEWVIRI